MKITNLKLDMFNWVSEPWMTGVGTQFGSTQQLGVVTVETDEGVSGNSFLGSSRMGADHFALGLIEFIKPIVIGRNPLDIGAIWADMYKMNRSVSTYVIAAVDVCLWDINGKLAGQPIHRLLGTCRDSVPVYSSTAYWETKEEYVEEALRFKEMGWPAHKIHPHGNPAYDIEICEAVADAVGDDMKLMLDSMWAYCYEDALRVGRAIEDLDFYWYEDPLAEEDIYSYVKLHEKLDIPIMSTEYAPGPILRHGLLDHPVRHRHPPRRRPRHRRHHPSRPALPHGRGLQDEVRDSPWRQLPQQRRQPPRHHGRPQLRVLRVLPVHRRQHVRTRRGHRHDRRHSPRPDRARTRLPDRLGPHPPRAHRDCRISVSKQPPTVIPAEAGIQRGGDGRSAKADSGLYAIALKLPQINA